MTASASEQYEFVVGERPTIAARHAVGTLNVVAGRPGQAQIVVTKRARAGIFGATSEKDLAELQVLVTQDGNLITIKTRSPRRIGIMKQYTIDIDVTTPATSDLDLQVAAGSAEVQGITGVLRVEAQAGSFEAREVTFADGSQLTVNAGQVVADGALAANASMKVEVNAGSVTLTLPHETAVNLDAKANAGLLELNGWPIHVTHRTVQQSAVGPLAPNASGVLLARVNAGSLAIRSR